MIVVLLVPHYSTTLQSNLAMKTKCKMEFSYFFLVQSLFRRLEEAYWVTTEMYCFAAAKLYLFKNKYKKHLNDFRSFLREKLFSFSVVF